MKSIAACLSGAFCNLSVILFFTRIILGNFASVIKSNDYER